MEKVTISAAPREDLGKKATKSFRKQGLTPCVMYGGEKPVHFLAKSKELKSLVYTPDFKVAEIQVDGQAYNAVMKDLQFHPVTDNLLHIDFQELVPGKAIKAELPVRLTGLAVGVKAGGKMLLNLRKLAVKMTPESMVDHIELDVTELQLGKSIKVSSIEAGNLEILTPQNIPVATVEIPRALKSAASKEDSAAAGETTEAAEE